MSEIKNITLSDGCNFVGHFKDGKREGVGIKTYSNGAKFEGIYVNDVRHGIGFKTHADGKIVPVAYNNGVKLDEVTHDVPAGKE